MLKRKQNMFDYKFKLKEILDLIELIEKSTSEGMNLKEFYDNRDLFDATLMRIQVIGECIRVIPFELKKEYKMVRWKKFARLRNLISHRYSDVEEHLIWSFIRETLPTLKKEIQNILSQIK
jgi:uncharacterized protein with HEPN domain